MIYATALEIAAQTGQAVQNVYNGIKRVSDRYNMTVNSIEYEIESNKIVKLKLNDMTFKRGASNKWIAH